MPLRVLLASRWLHFLPHAKNRAGDRGAGERRKRLSRTERRRQGSPPAVTCSTVICSDSTPPNGLALREARRLPEGYRFFRADRNTLTETFPRGYYFLADQLNRASLAIATNLAEGNGHFTKPDRTNFFVVARASAQECVPLLELARRKGFVKEMPRRD